MTLDEFRDVDAIGQAELVRDGEVTALELVDAAIARIEAARGLNAVICDLFAFARAEAAKPLPDGPLAGAPFLLKDLGGALAGVPDRMGSVALRDHVATTEPWLIGRYRAAGLVVCGKTNTPEWGNHCTTEPTLFGPTVNPWAPDRSPGGSSGGSAVAVATGLVPLASGGDGTGSIRVPASCCGVVGLKPRRGRMSFAPGAGDSLSGLVNLHGLTFSVRDCAALLDASAGVVAGDPYTAPPAATTFSEAAASEPPPTRILMTADPPFGGTTDPEVRAAVESVGRLLVDLGHEVDAGAPDFDGDAVTDAVAVLHAISNVELHDLAAEHLGRAPREDEFEPSSWEMMREGFATTGMQLQHAIGQVHAQGRRFADGLAAHDVLLCPTLLTTLPPLGHLNQPRGSVRAFFETEFATTGWTPMANVSGWAAISLPLGRTADGWPIGVQLMAEEESILLALAAQLEQATGWERPVSASA
ncbi:MAG: amidase [Solirubrobacteraceae bacterium]|nr:amidase [Solirubrobacteraceae bacterium]